MSFTHLRKHLTTHWFSYLLGIVFCLSIAVRSLQLNAQPLDAHPMRQTDTACVIHFFYTGSLNILGPQTCLIRPPTNVQGFFFLEFPAYEWSVGVFQKILHTEAWWTVRVFNLALFSLAFWSLYEGSKRYFNRNVALFAVLIFSWMPSSLFFFGQAVHPDIFTIATLFLSWNLLTYYVKSGKTWSFIVYLIVFSLSVATRPFVALAMWPFALVLFQNGYWVQAIIAACVPVAPYFGWSEWQKRFPESSYDWQQWVLTGREELYKLPVLRNLIMKNVVGEVVGKVTTALLGIGVVSLLFTKDRMKYLFCLAYLCAIPFYWYIVPAGNLAHQYYAHVFIFPIILLAAQALAFTVERIKNKMFALPLVCVVIGLILLNGYRTSRYFYLPRISSEEQQMAKQIAESVPVGEKVVYLGQSSLPFSMAYRQGWDSANPPADLNQTAASVRGVLPAARYIVEPYYDLSFPEAEKKELLKSPNFKIVSKSNVGAIYRVEQ